MRVKDLVPSLDGLHPARALDRQRLAGLPWDAPNADPLTR